MDITALSPQKNFWLKFFEVLCLLLVIIGFLQVFDASSAWQYNLTSNTAKLLPALAVMIVVSLIITFCWQRSGKGNHLHKWFEGVIIFYVAYAISVYGFAKLMKTQFQPPRSVMETPVGDLNGFWLTWVYYGHSQILADILGLTQVAGSILLLFRKTRLVGVFMLLPVMVNIDLVNQFYDISPLAYFNSAHYTFILLFLLLLDYEKLKIVFSYRGTMPLNIQTGLLNVARIAVIAFAFLNIYSLKKGIAPATKINGEWKVESIAKNNVVTMPDDCQDSVWSKLYFEWRYGCLFRYNANKFEDDKDLYGDYEVNEKQHSLLVSFAASDKAPDSALLHYHFVNDSLLNVYGKYKTDSIAMTLKRLK